MTTKPPKSDQEFASPIDQTPRAKLGNENLSRQLTEEEQELLREIIHSLRSMRFGSIVVTVHDGHVVEVGTTVRVRKLVSKDNT